MRKLFSIYLVISTVTAVFTSCVHSDDNEAIINPYSALTSFSIGSFRVYTPSLTAEGKDTLLSKTAIGSLYPFAINQNERTVFNTDSLPFGSDVSRLTIGISCDGAAYIYNDSTNIYDLISSSDSLDFTSPRRILVASTDGEYALEYSARVNVHLVDPELMYWKKMNPAAVATPERALVHDGKLFVYGRQKDGAIALTTVALEGETEWSDVSTIALSATADIAAIQIFNNKFYVVADGTLYSSEDGETWESAASDNITKLLAASDSDGRMWAVKDDSIAYSTNGNDFIATEAVPQDFPLYNISAISYPLTTNYNITRNMLIGYPTAQNSEPKVWSMLSTEESWVEYRPSGNGEYNCPSLADLSVIRYDGALFAFGSAGKFAGEEVEAFSTLFKSPDNGLTWHAIKSKLELPEEMRGSTAPYAAVVDENNRLWIVSGGNTPTVWCGIINRLLF